jgi:hypothetical protein
MDIHSKVGATISETASLRACHSPGPSHLQHGQNRCNCFVLQDPEVLSPSTVRKPFSSPFPPVTTQAPLYREVGLRPPAWPLPVAASDSVILNLKRELRGPPGDVQVGPYAAALSLSSSFLPYRVGCDGVQRLWHVALHLLPVAARAPTWTGCWNGALQFAPR